jgi:hypothetical protein
VELIRPHIIEWDFSARESELFGERETIPTWTLANKCRRILADTVRQLSSRIAGFDQPTLVSSLHAQPARNLAAIQLGSLVVRSCSARTALISCGYEVEALGPTRSSWEGVLRIRAVNDDGSGEYARKVLAGRAPRNLKALAAKYGSKDEIELLDHFAHSDVRTLLPLSDRARRDATDPEMELDLRPTRGQMRPAYQLWDSSYVALNAAIGVCEVFGVGLRVPPWVSGQLQHLRDNPLQAPL